MRNRSMSISVIFMVSFLPPEHQFCIRQPDVLPAYFSVNRLTRRLRHLTLRVLIR